MARSKRRAPGSSLLCGAADLAPRPAQGLAGITSGKGGAQAAMARRRRPQPASRPPCRASPDRGSGSVPRAAHLSPPVCPCNSCSSRCSHALPSSQSLTSWSHPARCNHPALCEATGSRAAQGGGRGAKRLQSPERPRQPNAALARRKPGAAGRGVRGGGGAAGGGRRRPRSAAPGSASAGSERTASARRVQLS